MNIYNTKQISDRKMQKLERGVQKVETIYEFGLNVRLLHSRRLLGDSIYTNEGEEVGATISQFGCCSVG